MGGSASSHVKCGRCFATMSLRVNYDIIQSRALKKLLKHC